MILRRYRLAGALSIPPNAKAKSSLKGVFLFDNALSGTIPTELLQFSDLGKWEIKMAALFLKLVCATAAHSQRCVSRCTS